MPDSLKLLSPTKSKIIRQLMGRRRTAKQVALSLSIQVSAARKHLESLQESGLAKEEFVKEGVGRPKKFYALTNFCRDLFPSQYSTMLNLVLSKLEADDTSKGEILMRQIAQDVLLDFGFSAKGQGEGFDGLMSLLSSFGFLPLLEERADAIVLTSRHCPLYKIASEHSNLVCNAFHDEMIKLAMGSNSVMLEKCIAGGDSACRHIIFKKSGQMPDR